MRLFAIAFVIIAMYAAYDSVRHENMKHMPTRGYSEHRIGQHFDNQKCT